MRNERSQFGLVVIGRNEGDRLRRCLESAVASGAPIVYVDSGSTDGSLDLARSKDVDVVELDLALPFTAARARNAGFARLIELHRGLSYVQFVDGDCELAAGWLERAKSELELDPGLAVVCGRRAERHRDATVYNRLCDMEWETPVGAVESCGGDAMMRASAFADVGGFKAELIAGEEPELCVRIRARGHRIRRIDAAMTWHDANLVRFGQWWTRSLRSGHAAAEGLALHGSRSNATNSRIVQSAGTWVGLLLAWIGFGIAALLATAARTPALVYSAAAAALLALQLVRTAHVRAARGNTARDAATYAVFCLLAKPAELAGAVRFVRNARRGRRSELIEYKAPHGRGARGPHALPRVAYLVNQYPKTSHSFIRREIAALEEQGFAIQRVSIRRVKEALVDERDVAESGKTRVLLDEHVAKLLVTAFSTALARPLRFAAAARLALSLGWRSPRGALYHLVYLVEACTLARWLGRAGIEHLHAHFATNPATVACLARALGGPRYSFTFHGPEAFDAPNYRALATKIEHAAFVVAISDHGKSQLYRWSDPRAWEKIAVVRCGLDALFLDAAPSPVPEKPRLVCVARLAPEKGHLVLLEAAKRLLDEGVDFEIECIGDGAFRPTIEARIAKLGLADRVHLRGWKSNDGVRQAIVDSRALVLPSFDEGLPVVFMEAFALERPVIATYIAGIPELVEHGASGWLVPAGNLERLAAVMREALTADPAKLSSMGANGRARVRRDHVVGTEAESLRRWITGFRSTKLRPVPRAPSTRIRRSA